VRQAGGDRVAARLELRVRQRLVIARAAAGPARSRAP
jgi:hypothetical protein